MASSSLRRLPSSRAVITVIALASPIPLIFTGLSVNFLAINSIFL